jgi:hypothetical protein
VTEGGAVVAHSSAGWRSVPRSLAASLVFATAAARVASAQVPDPGEKCGTPTASRPKPAGTQMGAGDPETGRYPGAMVPVSLPLGTPATELPGAPTSSLPPTPTGTQATPPTNAPPPQVPGLPPTGPKEGDKDDRPRVEAIQAKGEVPEERLLDLGIELFDPGADEGDRAKLAKVGLSPELRRSEARFMSSHLKKTLESTGHWGAVRVVPGAGGEGFDLTVTGRIRESNGKRIVLDVAALDARGEKWLDKRYRGEADTSAYRTERVGQQEAFQEVYNRIANDLLLAREERDVEDLATVRQLASLRFAAQLLPEAFSPYLKSNGSGRFTLVRAPADDDPMVRRIASIRERDQMLVDTLNDHYLGFYEKMSGPYASWKMYTYEEQDALDRVQRQSMLKKILGGAAMVMGMLMTPNSRGEAAARDAAIIGGGLVLQSGFQQAQGKGLHQAALKELSTSFDADVAPLLVEVEGQQRKLTGPAETQFAAWRELLRQVLSLETGKPADPNDVLVVAAPNTSH